MGLTDPVSMVSLICRCRKTTFHVHVSNAEKNFEEGECAYILLSGHCKQLQCDEKSAQQLDLFRLALMLNGKQKLSGSNI